MSTNKQKGNHMKTILLVLLILVSGCDEDAIKSFNQSSQETVNTEGQKIETTSTVQPENMRLYTGVVNMDGTPGTLPGGWESSYNGIGVYNITHGFNMVDPSSELVVIVTPADIQGLSAVVTTNGEDTITVIITNHDGDNVDARFRFIASRLFNQY